MTIRSSLLWRRSWLHPLWELPPTCLTSKVSSSPSYWRIVRYLYFTPVSSVFPSVYIERSATTRMQTKTICGTFCEAGTETFLWACATVSLVLLYVDRWIGTGLRTPHESDPVYIHRQPWSLFANRRVCLGLSSISLLREPRAVIQQWKRSTHNSRLQYAGFLTCPLAIGVEQDVFTTRTFLREQISHFWIHELALGRLVMKFYEYLQRNEGKPRCSEVYTAALVHLW